MDYLCLQLRDSGNGPVSVDLVLQPAPEEEVQGSEVRTSGGPRVGESLSDRVSRELACDPIAGWKVRSSAILHEPPAVRCNQRVVERGEEVCLLRVREGVVHEVRVETVTEHSSVAKKKGPRIPEELRAHHTVTLGECRGVCRTSLGRSVPQCTEL